MQMQQAELQFCIDLLKNRSGLTLGHDKSYLIESRLLPIARNNGVDNVPALVERIRTNPKETIVNEIVEAMTTNESLFFRDQKPFDYLRQKLLPQYKTAGKGSLRIWSAACSTGQEPCSIAMCFEEEMQNAGIRADITGTDLAGKVLDRAKAGIYTQFEVQRGMPMNLLNKYFTHLHNMDWQIKPVISSKITYRTYNLLDDYSLLGKFDIIFCRNVLIYFDDDARGQIIARLARALNPAGYLYLGSTEIIVDKFRMFSPVDECRGLYRLK